MEWGSTVAERQVEVKADTVWGASVSVAWRRR